ncbi:glycerophosphodiester phosphodiesterase family protein [Porphyrobacter sp. AAP60]|uniref:glycerophosphodiester phosphodiesterase family protein n=1 Tax=Porphyrobacter sp. AAP60 TaxID=1523423 RepID=UPI0006B9DCB4|nr:glycerophosphodiester phosphodiesterase family protein [Porphyrobacter sp. AAP60]KPF63569.1 glycerophosphodiester phosphodiesterase [Porphyrobacter sp. AAP60]
MKRRRAFLLAAVLLVGAVYFANASWLAPEPQGEARLMAHRGIHQLYDRTGIDKDTCTANRMLPPTNPYIENTLPSIAASFQAGADILEIDIHPTTDNAFVVFHDWTIDCRTEGKGVTRELSLEYLKSLDVGYGYTADGGKTFPFRGQGKGMMPSLAEVLKAFPEQRFLINFKSRWIEEADLLHAYLERNGIVIDDKIMVYGHEKPVGRWKAINPNGFAFSKAEMKKCTLDYMKVSWSTNLPASCVDSVIGVPINYRQLVWGWPNRFLERMRQSNTTVIFLGNVENENGAPGITDPDDIDAVPSGFNGLIWTDAIERVGPAWTKKAGERASGA